MTYSVKNSKSNTWKNGIIFVSLFVLQQIIAFAVLPFNLVTPYWILVVALFIAVVFPFLSKAKERPESLTFMLVTLILSFFTFLNGSTIGEIVTKILYVFIGYCGLLFVENRKIKLDVFAFLLIILYIVFYFSYFQYDESTRRMMDGDLNGHSSSNTIAMVLNIVIYFYILLSRAYKENHTKKLLIFSSLNFFLIILQGSRAGMLVALMILLIVVLFAYNINTWWKKLLLYVFVAAFASYFVTSNLDVLDEFLNTNEIYADAYEDDVRSYAVTAFFSKMDIINFFTGYDYNYEFVFGIHRTFNAFFDFWKSYGFLPFAFLSILLLKRIIHYKEYDIPVVMLLPFIVYSLFESLWGGSFWDVLLFIILFYSRKYEKKNKKNIVNTNKIEKMV